MAWQTVGGELVLLQGGTQVAFGLNRVAAEIWALLDGEHSIDDITAALVNRFAVERDVAARDVRAFVAKLLDLGVLEVRANAQQPGVV
jgi:hypothetical protein